MTRPITQPQRAALENEARQLWKEQIKPQLKREDARTRPAWDAYTNVVDVAYGSRQLEAAQKLLALPPNERTAYPPGTMRLAEITVALKSHQARGSYKGAKRIDRVSAFVGGLVALAPALATGAVAALFSANPRRAFRKGVMYTSVAITAPVSNAVALAATPIVAVFDLAEQARGAQGSTTLARYRQAGTSWRHLKGEVDMRSRVSLYRPDGL